MAGADVAAALHRLHLACVEPLIIAARKRGRLAACGVGGLGEIACAEIALGCEASAAALGCAAAAARERRYLARYVDGSDKPRWSSQWRGVPAVIDLGGYADFASYADRVRRHSKGGVLRQVRKARAEGFFCRTIHRDFYRRQLFAIDTSKRFRSGLVLGSLLRRPPASDFPAGVSPGDIALHLGRPVSEIVAGAALPEPPPPVCPLHWNLEWGVFAPADFATAPRERRLVGYIALRRSGNIVRTTGLMGHGDYLARNIMKLLLHDVMEWLLRRSDPRVAGLRYLLYGALEHGNDGLFAWKRSFEFAPMRLGYGATRSSGQTGRRTLSKSSGV